RLGLAEHVHDPAEPVPAPAGRPDDAGGDGEVGAKRLGEVRQVAALIGGDRGPSRTRGSTGRTAPRPRAAPALTAPLPGARAGRPAQRRLAVRAAGPPLLPAVHAGPARPHDLLLAVLVGRPDRKGLHGDREL